MLQNFSKNNSGFDIIWIKYRENRRHNGNFFYNSKINTAWTPILKVKRAFMVGRYKSVQVIREQFPIRAAAAKTCHRCQGDTMDSAVVDFNGRCFPHCHYVSLSRVKKIETLFIRDLNEKKIHIDATVVEEMQRLQKTMKLIPSFKDLLEPSNHFTIYYQNVRSFNKHNRDGLQDIHIYHPDIMIFVESKLGSKDQDQDFTINGYIMQRFDIINTDGSRFPYGIVVYNKENLPEIQLQCKHINKKKGEEFVEAVFLEIKQSITKTCLHIGGIYSSPKTKFKTLQDFLKFDCKIFFEEVEILVGDFNMDGNKKSITENFLQLFQGFTQLISKPTTEYNPLLDHVYVKNDLKESANCHVLGTFFSDHFPIHISLETFVKKTFADP